MISTIMMNVTVDKLVNEIKESIKIKRINKEIEEFIFDWLSDDKITQFQRDVFYQLAVKSVLPFEGSNCFRGCKKVMDGQAESYSTSIETASRFAGKNGYVIAVDAERTCYYTFALNDYLSMIFMDYIEGTKPDIYPKELIDKIEETIAEEEIIVITDIKESSLFKVVNIGEKIV